MRTKPPQGVGVMIRDVLRERQPISITEVRREVNSRRDENGMRPIGYPTMKRYFKQAVNLGMLKVVGVEDREEERNRPLPDGVETRNLYRIVRGYTMDKRWGYLPSIVAGRAF